MGQIRDESFILAAEIPKQAPNDRSFLHLFHEV